MTHGTLRDFEVPNLATRFSFRRILAVTIPSRRTMPLHMQLEEIPQRAARLCDTPAALLAFIDDDQHWFRSSVGVALEDQKGGTCFCAQAVCGNDLYVVTDAASDPLFMREPIVREAGIRFYAGMPLVARSGFPFGTIAILDHQPRTLTEAQAEAIRVLASLVMMELDHQRQSSRVATLQEEQRCLTDILQERSRHLDTVQRLNCTGSWEIGLRGRQLRCSDEMYRIFGIERNASGDDINTFMQLIHAEDRRNVVIAQERALRGYGPLEAEFRVVRPDGEERYVHMRAELGPVRCRTLPRNGKSPSTCDSSKPAWRI
jgi:PAS domain-containing protein